MIGGRAVSGQSHYGQTWRRLWGGAVAVCVALSALEVHPAVLLASAVAGAVVAGVVSLVVSSDQESPLETRLLLLREATVWGAATLAATVFVGTFSSSLLFWALLAALFSSPAVVTPARAAIAQLTGPTDGAAAHLPLERANREVLARLTSAELCQAWRSTHQRLQVTRTAPEVAAYARLRQLVLEELELRHPREVAVWLSAGGKADQGPVVFSPGTDG
jgi:hypothetical protein